MRPYHNIVPIRGSIVPFGKQCVIRLPCVEIRGKRRKSTICDRALETGTYLTEDKEWTIVKALVLVFFAKSHKIRDEHFVEGGAGNMS